MIPLQIHLGGTRVMCTLLHETADSIARGRGIKDTSRIIRLFKTTYAQGPIFCNFCWETFEIAQTTPHLIES